MTVNRRAFLGLLASAAAGAVLDPERLLWVPGRKTIFIPSARQVAVYGGAAGGGKTFTFHGIPWVMHDGFYRSGYFGVSRDLVPQLVTAHKKE